MIAPPNTAKALIEVLVQRTGASDPLSAIRMKAEQAIELYTETFGEPEEMPLDLLTLASLLGIRQSESAPAFSPDAEIVPDGDGGVEMRLNPDRPETRQRFSIGHEITHTFFPDHASHVWPRANPRYRDLRDPNDYIEMLCDAGAAELVFPRSWFVVDAAGVRTAEDLVLLARRYKASREATLRRYAELHPETVAAVYFSWKLKPSQHRTVGSTDQYNLFGCDPKAEAVAARRLRIEYSIPSESFAAARYYLPRDKSVFNTGPLYVAASIGEPADGECHLELGQASGTYVVHAVPLWTAEEEQGPNGENAVGAILRPLRIGQPKQKAKTNQPKLFE